MGETFRPVIHIEISYTDSINYEVLVDSGADFCIFDAEVAEAIGITDITTGDKFTFGGVTGKEAVGYMHKVTFNIKDCKYSTNVGFSSEFSDNGYGIVGQKGFFDRFAVKFDYAEKTIVLRKKDWA